MLGGPPRPASARPGAAAEIVAAALLLQTASCRPPGSRQEGAPGPESASSRVRNDLCGQRTFAEQIRDPTSRHARRDGAHAGAPQTRQVADAWHLLHNLAEAVERVIGGTAPTCANLSLSEKTSMTCPVPERSPRTSWTSTEGHVSWSPAPANATSRSTNASSAATACVPSPANSTSVAAPSCASPPPCNPVVRSAERVTGCHASCVCGGSADLLVVSDQGLPTPPFGEGSPSVCGGGCLSQARKGAHRRAVRRRAFPVHPADEVAYTSEEAFLRAANILRALLGTGAVGADVRNSRASFGGGTTRTQAPSRSWPPVSAAPSRTTAPPPRT